MVYGLRQKHSINLINITWWIGVSPLSIRAESNMTIKQIKKLVEEAQKFPNATIEYNDNDLPKHKDIKVDMFFGIKAKYNKDANNSHIIYSY